MRARVPTSARFSICLSIIFLPFSSWAGSIFFSLLCFSVSNYVYIRTTKPNRRSAGRRGGETAIVPSLHYSPIDLLIASMLASGVTRPIAIAGGRSGPEGRAVWGPLPPPSVRPRPRAILAPAGLRRLVIATGCAAATDAAVRRTSRVAVAPLGVHQLREFKKKSHKKALVRCKEGGELSVTEQNRTQWTPIPWHCRSFHPHGHGIIFLSFFIYFKDKKAKQDS